MWEGLTKKWVKKTKIFLLRSVGPSTRQRVALPSATECPTLGKGRHSAKKWHLTAESAHAVKFKKKIFAECRPWHSAKRAFAECQGPALGKDPFFAECHFLALGKGPLCRVPGPTLGKIFFLVFFIYFFVRPSHII